MIELTKGEFCKWKNPATGGWQTGNFVMHPQVEGENADVFVSNEGTVFRMYFEHGHGDEVLVQGTYGGLFFVKWSEVSRILDRAEYETA